MKIIIALVLGTLATFAAQPDTLIAHEWGTFTSVADVNGNAVNWAPLSGPGDLPCFVQRATAIQPKGNLSGLIRMETPVLYFYSSRPTTLAVHVDFPQGWITEWYPKADVSSFGGWLAGGVIDWKNIQVLPGPDLEYPASSGASHYFYARNTDSAPLRIDNQQEKLLFYRGVGNFRPPLRPKYVADGKISLNDVDANPIPVAIVFENQGGKIDYRVVRNVKDVTVDAPEITGDLDQLRGQLADELTNLGLYRKEALAMVETWRDSWFEEGARVFYLMPQAQVNAVLPLKITPAPSSTARVFVGRVEMLSPWTRQTIQSAMKNGDVQTLAKFGRFLDPFLREIQGGNPAIAAEQLNNGFLLAARIEIQKASHSTNGWNADACVE